MALSDKNILITPNIGSSSDPKIVFSGASASIGAQNITLNVYPTNNGTLSFEGSNGQLFSIGNTMSGTIYSVNDISGMPSIEVLDTGLIKLGQYSGNILLGTATDNGNKLQVNGSIIATGNITAYSDERLKTNWRDLPTNYIIKLAGVKSGIYDRVDQVNVTQVGVSAQSLEMILPEAVAVAKDEEKTLSINYGAAALVSAIELAKCVVDQEARIKYLEDLISKLIKE